MKRLMTIVAALAAPSLLVGSVPPAAATCVGTTCVAGPPGSVEPSNPTGGSNGTQCEYIKLNPPPPFDWQGNRNAPAPYFFTRTIEWGRAYPGQWDSRGCVFPKTGGRPPDANDLAEYVRDVLDS